MRSDPPACTLRLMSACRVTTHEARPYKRPQNAPRDHRPHELTGTPRGGKGFRPLRVDGKRYEGIIAAKKALRIGRETLTRYFAEGRAQWEKSWSSL